MLDEAALTVFATDYFRHPDERFGGDCRVSLAALFYEFGPAGRDTIEVDGEERDLTDFAGLRPWERGAVDDYVIRTVVDSVETVDLSGHEVHRIEGPLFRAEDGPAEAAFYVGDHVAGDYVPEPGDSVEGAAWLQGQVAGVKLD
ncbi:hypothetical protein BRD17_01115 [Halobacteriales archaeon SW_7_68_16]|nr:MAG: hypothetical protein BRD17_01115 [Halobacteriales archaeon SW_7_68_16]